jgi:cytochrome c551/c552
MTQQPVSSKSSSRPSRTSPLAKVLRLIVLIVVGVLLALFIGIQFIPVNRTNPPVTAQVKWDSPQTQALARRACMDCHSNETTWPWYSYVAPVSWLVYYDVQRGRSEITLSTLGTSRQGPGAFGPSNDLAYRFGQMLAGGGRPGELGRPPEGQFQPPANGQQPPPGQFPSGGRGVAGRITEQIRNGQMPPANYLLMHPNAKLTDAERQQLVQGLSATLGQPAP